jgi:hypothetical protein
MTKIIVDSTGKVLIKNNESCLQKNSIKIGTKSNEKAKPMKSS